MLLNSVIIILSEVLEAAFLLSMLLVISQQFSLHWRWIAWGIPAGLTGAWGYGNTIDTVSDMWDGIGQELINGILQYGITALLMVLAWQLSVRPVKTKGMATLSILLSFAALTREGSEIYIYLYGFIGSADLLPSVISGSIIGAVIGFSAGAIFYYLVLSLPARARLICLKTFLALIAASMSIQATKLMIQADLISSSGPVWDSSWLISESSIGGRLLYALIGYEASPSATEASCYLATLVIFCLIYGLPRFSVYRSHTPSPLD